MLESAHMAMNLADQVRAFCALLEQGKTIEAIEQFYAEDVHVIENRKLVRAGRVACVKYEREQLGGQAQRPQIRVRRSAVDEANQVAFLEYVMRFTGPGARPMRIEEVSVQKWERGQISEERFYYEGIVDEGD